MPGAPRRTARLLVPVTALAAGLLFATGAATSQGSDLRPGRRVQLAELIGQERQQVARTQARAASLRAEVAALSARSAARDDRVAAERARGDALGFASATVPVAGPGLSVALDDAPRGTAGGQPDDLVVHQQDVQAVVNALWAGGAEGMTLMGQRVVSTSAVRCVGNTIVLQGQVYGPPFVVAAVGDPAGMRAALGREPAVELYRRYVDRFGLGYDVTASPRLTLPAYTGSLNLPAVRAGAS